MVGRLIQATKSAYQYPLIFKQLWHTPLRAGAGSGDRLSRSQALHLSPDQGADRPSRIGPEQSGCPPGDTVGVLDWDSHRFLEAFFAIPMMGAVLQTVNVRLSPEQIAYTINHAGASTLLVNDEFVGLLEGLEGRNCRRSRRLVVMSDRPAPQTGSLSFVGEYERPAGCGFARLRLSRFRREHPGDHVLHDRHDRPAQGRLLQPSAARAAFAVRAGLLRDGGHSRAAFRATTSTCRSRRCFTSTPGAFPGRRRSPASSRSIPGATSRRCCSS